METTFTIPDGFELKQTGENKFEVVRKETPDQTISHVYQDTVTQGNVYDIQRQQMQNAIDARWDGLGFVHGHGSQQNDLFEKRFSNGALLHEMYKSGDIQGLTRHEMELLRFCHNTDMRKFLKEEVGNKPIDYSKIDGSFDGIGYY